MTRQLGIVDLLRIFGFDERIKTKLVRHQDTRYDISKLISEGWFDLYQSLQSRPVFSGCQQIISFIGDGGTRARLLGVFRVLSQQIADPLIVPVDCPYQEWRSLAKMTYYYELERATEFADLEGRVVVEWGAGALAWHQHLKNKPVIEIRPTGRLLEPFTDYSDFTLSYSELRNLVSSSSAHSDWVASLSAVSGVYLILAEKTGHLYVGSAYGTGGIWARWSQYAVNGHGGNTRLRQLLKSDADYPESFRYSILQVLPKTASQKEVIRWESRLKQKLGSRATGLNLN